MKERERVMAGGCQCGAVRYALFSHPVSSLCHCRMCQKAVGGPFAALCKVDLTDFAWTRGTPQVFRSSSAAARDFCADCGTPLTFRYLDEETIEVTTGSLDRPAQAAPTRIFGIESKLPWIAEALQGGLPEERTDEPHKKRRSVVSYQHPDQDTGPDWRPHI